MASTTAEFVPNSFSAVAAFFGCDHEKEGNERAKNKTVPSSRRGRHGVGAVVAINASDDSLTKQFLHVGKKQRIDDHFHDEVMVQESDDDEDQGRTGIATSHKTIYSPDKHVDPLVSVEALIKKKKKSGKKERLSEKIVDETIVIPTTANGEITAPISVCETDDISKKKKHRRKVRSKQKNIYKDHRTSQAKPEHLRVGRPAFQGRPLTAETRHKLCLPPSKTVQQRENCAMETFPIQRNSSMTLGVNNLMVEDLGQTDAGAHENVEQSRKKKKMDQNSKGKKRKKYKNLE